MQEHTVTFLNLSYRSSKLRDEANRLNDISEGLMEDSRRLRNDAAELRINVRWCLAKISPQKFFLANRTRESIPESKGVGPISRVPCKMLA